MKIQIYIFYINILTFKTQLTMAFLSKHTKENVYNA